MTEFYKGITGLEVYATCCTLPSKMLSEIMDESVKADGRKIRKLIRELLPWLYDELALQFPNSYENQSRRTKKFLIYVHSSIEYFLEISRGEQ